MYNQRIKLNLHKYKTIGVQQFNIDKVSDDDDDDFDDHSDQSSITASDDDFSGSESESYQDTTGSTGPSEATTDEMLWGRRRAPVCGVAATTVRRQILQNGPRDPMVLGDNKHVYQKYLPQPQMGTSHQKELYSQVRRGERSSYRQQRERYIPPRKSRVMHGSSDLSAIEEMSSIRSETYSTSSEVPSMPPSSLKNKVEWKPQLTSTTTSFQPLSSLDTTFDDGENNFKVPISPVLCSSTPRSERLYRKNTKYGRHSSMIQLPPPRTGSSMSMASERVHSPDPWVEQNNENQMPNNLPVKPVSVGRIIRPETFGLDNAFAKNKDIRGIVFLAMSLCGRRLTLTVQNAYYFRGPAQPLPVCSYLSAVLCHRSRATSRRLNPKPDECYRTRLVTNSNNPTFDESFQFTFAENCSRDALVVTIYEMDSGNAEKKKVLGCMTFPVSRLLKKANQMVGDQYYQHRRTEDLEDIEINNEGFFLLNKEQGRKQNFPQRKVRRQTYYEDPAFIGMSSASSSVISNNPGQMTAASPRLSVPNELTMGDYYRSSNDLRVRSTANLLDYTSASSSTNGSSAAPEKLKFHRATLPSITTTTSENNSDDAKSLSPERHPTDHNFLCPDDNGGVYGAGPTHSALKKSSVRRAASFTFSPKHSTSKTNLRSLAGREEDREKRRFL